MKRIAFCMSLCCLAIVIRANPVGSAEPRKSHPIHPKDKLGLVESADSNIKLNRLRQRPSPRLFLGTNEQKVLLSPARVKQYLVPKAGNNKTPKARIVRNRRSMLWAQKFKLEPLRDTDAVVEVNHLNREAPQGQQLRAAKALSFGAAHGHAASFERRNFQASRLKK